jgi:perosamine synthetase
MPMYNTQQSFMVAEDISRRGLNLPSYPDLSDDEVKYVIEKVLSH